MPGESQEPFPPRRRSRVFAVACDNYYYPGLRALLPSIAAYHGLDIPVFLYHRDLSKAQLQELGRLGVELCPFGLAGLPFPAPGMWEAKQQIFAHCIGRARCVYLLDADLVLVSALDDVFELARMGKVVSSADGGWRTFGSDYMAYSPGLVGLCQPYINSGALCLDVVRHWDLAGLWAFASNYGAYSPGAGVPLGLPGHGDQGVFNAVAGLLNKVPSFHVLPEGSWCDSTRGCTLRIRRRRRGGRLIVWNSTERTRQRLVHSSGPKWWTAEGAAHLRQFGDKLRCFEHFLTLKPGPKAQLPLPGRAGAQTRKRDVQRSV
jgi:hypothetical protein